MLNVFEVDELFELEDARREISMKVQALYDYPVKIGQDLENMKRSHSFFKELGSLLELETKAVKDMEQFLEKIIAKHS